jgi:hypothetical protein
MKKMTFWIRVFVGGKWAGMKRQDFLTLRIESFLKRKIILNIIFFFDVAKSFVEQKLSL